MTIRILAAVGAALVLVSGDVQAQAAGRGAVVKADTVVNVRSAGEDLEFFPNELAFKQGTRVTIRYTNMASFPHNFVIMKNENDIEAVGLAAFQADKTGYIPMEHAAKFIAHSALVQPNKVVEFTFVVPAPGTYTYVCLYPGHYNMMLGTLKSLR